MGLLILTVLALAGVVVGLAVWGHHTSRTRDRAKLRDLKAGDIERRAALRLLATIRNHASTADQAGNPLGGEITHLIDAFHRDPSH
ncbi:hypothetical protein [Nocardiopsis sp. FR26]|uniref:hypothetical protein n=1 Tax=Nocardiopsis sp. FR26 TaxID=2605987 RepID=UPI00135CC079|nr:hypothetical protein [Nocardiopsis sp. FR26]